MAKPLQVAPHSNAELVLARWLEASPDQLFRCWTEPALITQWFTPPPWKTVSAEIDARPGGKFYSTFNGRKARSSRTTASFSMSRPARG